MYIAIDPITESNVFAWVYGLIAEDGGCDLPHGAEYKRVLSTWNKLDRPSNLEYFIRQNANMGPDGLVPGPEQMRILMRKRKAKVLREISEDASAPRGVKRRFSDTYEHLVATGATSAADRKRAFVAWKEAGYPENLEYFIQQHARMDQDGRVPGYEVMAMRRIETRAKE